MRLVFDDGVIWDDVFTLTAIGNGKFCGGGYKALPEATLDDGMIDICAINKVSHFTLVRLIGSYKKGTHLQNKSAQKYFNTKRVDHFKMEFDSPVPLCIDGEIKGAMSIDFSIIKNAFNFVVPNGSEFIK